MSFKGLKALLEERRISKEQNGSAKATVANKSPNWSEASDYGGLAFAMAPKSIMNATAGSSVTNDTSTGANPAPAPIPFRFGVINAPPAAASTSESNIASRVNRPLPSATITSGALEELNNKTIADRIGQNRVGSVKDRLGPRRILGPCPVLPIHSRLGTSAETLDIGMAASCPMPGRLGKRWLSSASSTTSTSAPPAKKRLKLISDAKIMECFQEYDIDKMVGRADRLSDVPLLKKRARRFEEETANELVQLKEAKRKNVRFKRFKEEEEEEEETDDE